MTPDEAAAFFAAPTQQPAITAAAVTGGEDAEDLVRQLFVIVMLFWLMPFLSAGSHVVAWLQWIKIKNYHSYV